MTLAGVSSKSRYRTRSPASSESRAPERQPPSSCRTPARRRTSGLRRGRAARRRPYGGSSVGDWADDRPGPQALEDRRELDRLPAVGIDARGRCRSVRGRRRPPGTRRPRSGVHGATPLTVLAAESKPLRRVRSTSNSARPIARPACRSASEASARSRPCSAARQEAQKRARLRLPTPASWTVRTRPSSVRDGLAVLRGAGSGWGA